MNGSAVGRVLLLRWEAPLDGMGEPPQQVAARAAQNASRTVLLDITGVPYVDSDGLRWLLRLQNELEATGRTLRIAARRGGKVWRNLALLDAGLDLHESVASAWKNTVRKNARR